MQQRDVLLITSPLVGAMLSPPVKGKVIKQSTILPAQQDLQLIDDM